MNGLQQVTYIGNRKSQEWKDRIENEIQKLRKNQQNEQLGKDILGKGNRNSQDSGVKELDCEGKLMKDMWLEQNRPEEALS